MLYLFPYKYYLSNFRREGLDHLYTVSYMWYGSMAVLVNIIIASIISMFTGQYLIYNENFLPFYGVVNIFFHCLLLHF